MEVHMFLKSLMLVVLVAALGCGGSLIGKPMDEVKGELQGKTAKEVVSLMRKPAGVTEAGGIGGVDEVWSYLRAARHPATGAARSVSVQFRQGRVINVIGM